MKSLLTFLSALIIWYFIVSFVVWNPYIMTWHWTARLIFIILGLATYSKVNK